MKTLMPFKFSDSAPRFRAQTGERSLLGQISSNWFRFTDIISLPLRSPRGLLAAVFALGLTVAHAQDVSRLGGEFSLLGPIAGDQVWPALSLSSSGGVLTYEDNGIGGKGGVGGAWIDSSLNFQPGFRVPKSPLSGQIKPKGQLLRGTGTDNAVFVWESPVAGTPDIYLRFAKNGKITSATDVLVNTYTKDQQVDPDVAALADGGAIVVWSSYGQGGPLWGIFARKYTAAGTAATAKEFQVNQFHSNEHSPTVTALANGNYVAAWVSQQERFQSQSVPPIAGSVDIYARIFTSAGIPITDEFLVNSSTNLCANPALAPLGTGGFLVAWSQKDMAVPTNGWDIWGRAFLASGMPVTKDFTINSHLYGDQYMPKLAAGPNGVLAVWTSMGQDGDHEGVFGRYLAGGTQLTGTEFQANTTTVNRQMQPAVAWNGVDRFLVIWTSFEGTPGFDLMGQSYILNP
jgi:hypothetical protein